MAISEDTKPLTENDTEGTCKAITMEVRFCGKLKWQIE